VFELALIVCVSTAPDKCDTVYLPGDESLGMTQCLDNGPKQAARSAEEHPGHVVRHWNRG